VTRATAGGDSDFACDRGVGSYKGSGAAFDSLEVVREGLENAGDGFVFDVIGVVDDLAHCRVGLVSSGLVRQICLASSSAAIELIVVYSALYFGRTTSVNFRGNVTGSIRTQCQGVIISFLIC